jgi:ribosomal protein L17
MRRTSEERKQMVAALSNNLNEYALCEATAQKAEHFSHVLEKTRKSRGSDNLANAALAISAAARLCRIDTNASGRFCGD